jgi:predicted type IV restriction endonuclease
MAGSTSSKVADVVQRVRKRIQTVHERGERIGEQDTKAALIEPLLAALGWDLQDLDEVTREYRKDSQDNPVDYALFIVRSPCLFVEAKALGKDLGDRKWLSQTLSYATVVGIKWCVLTNGDEYRLYNAHAPVDVEKKLFRSVCISSAEDERELVDTLLLLSKEKMQEKELDVLWRAHFVDRQVKTALHDIFEEQENGLVRLIRKRTKELKPSEIRESLKRADVRIDFPVLTLPLGQTAATTTDVGSGDSKEQPTARVELSDIISAGLISPPLRLTKRYKGVDLEALVQGDGSVVYDGQPFDSPSTAAGMARKSVIGAPEGRAYPQTNGWVFWRFRDPDTGEFLKLDALRQRHLAQRSQ